MSTGSDFFSLDEEKAYPRPAEAASLRIGIITARWNHAITEQLTSACVQALLDRGVSLNNILVHHVPGCYEIPTGCQWLDHYQKVDALIAMGCLIKGETPHFEYISEAVTRGIMDLMLRLNKPIINSVLTVYNQEQALDRLGGTHGHKGIEAAQTALQMLRLKINLLNQSGS
ncbi:MAG: 6,7-dimethyl-8-ribityllumazine synthase [Bacteroidota bacterium]